MCKFWTGKLAQENRLYVVYIKTVFACLLSFTYSLSFCKDHRNRIVLEVGVELYTIELKSGSQILYSQTPTITQIVNQCWNSCYIGWFYIFLSKTMCSSLKLNSLLKTISWWLKTKDNKMLPTQLCIWLENLLEKYISL